MTDRREQTSEGADVIVPVYGAGEAFARCAQSLVRHTDLERHRLIVVLDGPQEPEVRRVAADLVANPGVRVLENDRREGFVISTNRGLVQSSRDVVLLNSDTRVTASWLEKLTVAAYSDPAIGTVTPFSNNATICSLPRFLAENTVPAGYDVESFAALVDERSERTYPELPTGVGVCLYVKREVIDAVGLLDQGRFGLGYGEETELCLRASRAGYRHVLDDATYIYHEGQRSFGKTRRRRVARAHRLLRSREPSYLPRVARFIREDPLEPVRNRIAAALAAEPRAATPAPPPPVRRILHLVHGWPPWAVGGTELYARWLATSQAADREVTVYARIEDQDRESGEAKEHLDHGVRVRLAVNNFTQRNPIARNALHDPVFARDLRRLLKETDPELIHVHHLAGHSASLLEVARRRGVPIVLQLQDWWHLCARVNLFHRDGHLCTGPGAIKCARCLPMTRLPGHRFLNPLLYAARAAWSRFLLSRADALVMGSHFIEWSFRSWGYLPADVPSHVIPYGIPDRTAGSKQNRSRGERHPLRFGCIGALMPHKGQDVAINAFRGIDPQTATLDVWGTFGADSTYNLRLTQLAETAPAVRIWGRFAENARRQILEELDVLIVPSLGLESFGIVAREAVASGVPVLASNRGALPEFVDGESAGWLFPAGNADALRQRIVGLCDRPGEVRRRSTALPDVKTVASHKEEIDAVYATLVPRGRS